MDNRTNAALAPAPRAASLGGYRARLAGSAADLRAAQSLRFKVFNLELQEGLAESYLTGVDSDPFDAVCDHLLLEASGGGALVGTYRMQSGSRAAQGIGYYCEREFDFAPYEPLRPHMLELGRACIAPGHRNYAALSALWRGVVAYAQAQGQRFLVGCSSLTSQDAAAGAAVYQMLAPHLAPLPLRTRPHAAFECSMHQRIGPAAQFAKVPKLLAAYMALGAHICGPPAIDREFRTIDFLTLLDLQPGSSAAASRLARFGVVHRSGG